MKEITAFENIDRSKSFEEQGLNGTLYWAYQNSKEAGNDLIDFGEVIWDYDIDPILENCKALGITEFTISSTFSSLIETIAKFEDLGCTLDGIVRVKERCTHFGSDEHALIPAFKMTVKEA